MEKYFFSSVTDVMILPVAFLSGEILKCGQKNQKMEVFFTVSCKLKKRITGQKFHQNILRKRGTFSCCVLLKLSEDSFMLI